MPKREEVAKIIVPIAGEDLELILPAHGWTFDEAKLAKEVSGMTPGEIEVQLMYVDPDAWMAVLRVSYHRAEKDFPAVAIGETDIIELGQVVSELVNKERTQRPPTKASGNGHSASDESSEKPETARS